VCVGARSDNAAVFEPGDRVHRAIVKAHHLLGDVSFKRPADRRGVEAVRDGAVAVGRNRQRAHWSAVAKQLRLRAGESEHR